MPQGWNESGLEYLDKRPSQSSSHRTTIVHSYHVINLDKCIAYFVTFGCTLTLRYKRLSEHARIGHQFLAG